MSALNKMKGSLVKQKHTSSTFAKPETNITAVSKQGKNFPPNQLSLLGFSKSKIELSSQLHSCTVSSISATNSQFESVRQTRHSIAGGSLSEYDVLKELGKGASGMVFLMRLKTEKSVWVIKQVSLGGHGSIAPLSDRQGLISKIERDNVLREVA